MTTTVKMSFWKEEHRDPDTAELTADVRLRKHLV